MKKILFDGLATQGTKENPFSGGADYATFVLNAAIESGYSPDLVLSSNLVTNKIVDTIIHKTQGLKVYYVESVKDVYRLLIENKYDRFYSALPSRYAGYCGQIPLIGVIHGLRSVELPWDECRPEYALGLKRVLIENLINYFPSIQNYLKIRHLENTRKLLQIQNAKFIVVSNHTKYALLHFYPKLKTTDIKVFYSPQDMKLCPTEKKDYYLMVNGNRFEKNVFRAVRTFDRLFSEGRLFGKSVVITGCTGQRFYKEIINKDRFDLLPYVDLAHLRQLYAEAFCFVYPSLNEGFGYPPIQAMSFGTPVIASSATSIPEVCSGAALYFSPTNEDDLAIRILQIAEDEKTRDTLVQRGYERVEELIRRQQCEVKEMLNYIFD